MRIICGTGFSFQDDKAAHAAGALAARLALPLTLVHVIDPSRYSVPSPELMGYLRRDREKKLQALTQRVSRKGAIVDTIIAEGSPAAELAEVAALNNARFLVVSASGQIAPTRWFAGSVTDQAVQLSPVPTLVLRNPDALETWLQGDRSLNVLIGYDFSGSADAALRWVGSLTAIAPCDITVAYVASQARERSRFGAAPTLSAPSYPAALQRFLEEAIQKRCRPIFGKKVRISITTEGGRPGSHLMDMAAAHHVDLMAVGASRRRGLNRLASVARSVVHYAQANVATVPEGWTAAQPAKLEFNRHTASRNISVFSEEMACEALN